MSSGRKTKTYNPARSTQGQTGTRQYGNQSVAAPRNLGEDNLAGVSFGCTHKTINECLSKQLFGLPSVHFSYVKNVKPGLPLFLFNYSDRKMHGIFEAASAGQSAIDQFAWSGDGRTKTQYPAQVRVSIKTQCLPLPENKYKSVISSNYYKPHHFHFELDHAQTEALIFLFVPATVRAVPNKRTRGPLLSPTVRAQQSLNGQHGTTVVTQNLQELDLLQEEKPQSSKSVVDSISDKSIPQASELDDTFLEDPSNATLEGGAGIGDTTSFGQHCGNDELLQIINELSKKTEAMEKKQIESDQETISLRKSLEDAERRVQQLQYQFDKLQWEHNSSRSPLGGRHNNVEEQSIFIIGGHNDITFFSSLDSFCPTTGRLESLGPMSSARSYAAVASWKDRVFVFGGGDSNSWYDTVECYNRWNNEWIACPRLGRKKTSLAGATLNDKIFDIGGGDGSQSFSEVEMFDPVRGSWIYSLSMEECRFAPAAAELNGILYVVGGYNCNSNTYLQSAEMYDPRQGSWIQLPNMSTKRASHSVAVLGEALYALGGHNGNQTVSTVEIFDARANSWRLCSPFNVPRGYACAVTVNDNIYLIGGIKSIGEIVETVEVYNERQGWSTPGYKALGKRSFASAVVL